MSDSVDRVFVHALATVRRLPRTGSSRPPPSARLRLYGLYKQSMEGDVVSILPRPTLPISSPDPSSTKTNANAVHRYASRDLRTREAQAEIEKWDAWNACAGLSKTEAKRRYISTLIETMKEYASGTAESRELVSELEFVWSQIRSQSGSSEGDKSTGGGAEGDQESPTRKLERAGLQHTISYDSITGPGQSPEPGGGDGGEGRGRSSPRRGSNQPLYTSSGLRILSPVSQQRIEDIIDGQEDTSLMPIHSQDTPDSVRIESHLRYLSTEIAALREQLASNHLLSSSSSASRHRSWRKRLPVFLRWLFVSAVRHLATDLAILLLLICWERFSKRGKNDTRRIEDWVRRRWKQTGDWISRLRWWSASWLYLSAGAASSTTHLDVTRRRDIGWFGR